MNFHRLFFLGSQDIRDILKIIHFETFVDHEGFHGQITMVRHSFSGLLCASASGFWLAVVIGF
jgi:hypothetical protein